MVERVSGASCLSLEQVVMMLVREYPLRESRRMRVSLELR